MLQPHKQISSHVKNPITPKIVDGFVSKTCLAHLLHAFVDFRTPTKFCSEEAGKDLDQGQTDIKNILESM